MKQKNSPLVGRIFGMGAILVALYTILFSGTPNFSNEDAERMLSELAAHFSAESGQRDGEAKLQYSNVEIRGFAYDKWAHVSNLAFDVMYQQWQGRARFGLSTEGADLVPEHTNRQRMSMRFADAVNLIAGSELLAMVRPARPILYVIQRKPLDMQDAIRHRLVIPADLGVTMLEPRREVRIELPNPVQAEVSFFQAPHRLHGQVASGTVRIVSQGDVWGMENADIRYDSVQKGPGALESKGTLALDRLTFARAGAATPPYTMTAAWAMKEQRNISGSIDAMQLDIDRALLTDGEVKISVGGILHFNIDDAPYGELVVEISHPADFVKSGWIAKDKQELALSLLDEIIGEKVGGHKQAIINIARVKNGTWMVGKMPLQALLDKGFSSLFIFNAQEPHDKNDSEKTSPPANPS